MRPVCSALLLLVCLLAAAPVAAQSFVVSYANGERAFKRGDWAATVAEMEKALAREPESAARRRLRGTIPEAYLPHHYLGLAAIRLGDCTRARTAFADPSNRSAVAGTPREVEQAQALTSCGPVTPASAPAPATPDTPPDAKIASAVPSPSTVTPAPARPTPAGPGSPPPRTSPSAAPVAAAVPPPAPAPSPAATPSAPAAARSNPEEARRALSGEVQLAERELQRLRASESAARLPAVQAAEAAVASARAALARPQAAEPELREARRILQQALSAATRATTLLAGLEARRAELRDLLSQAQQLRELTLLPRFDGQRARLDSLIAAAGSLGERRDAASLERSSRELKAAIRAVEDARRESEALDAGYRAILPMVQRALAGEHAAVLAARLPEELPAEVRAHALLLRAAALHAQALAEGEPPEAAAAEIRALLALRPAGFRWAENAHSPRFRDFAREHGL